MRVRSLVLSKQAAGILLAAPARAYELYCKLHPREASQREGSSAEDARNQQLMISEYDYDAIQITHTIPPGIEATNRR